MTYSTTESSTMSGYDTGKTNCMKFIYPSLRHSVVAITTMITPATATSAPTISTTTTTTATKTTATTATKPTRKPTTSDKNAITTTAHYT